MGSKGGITMSWGDQTVNQFEEALASSDPTPGGGTACAISLGQAAALTNMVCDLTLGKDKWEKGWNAANKALDISQKIASKSRKLANDDSDAFDEVMASFRLPKNTEKEKELRKSKIRTATLNAAIVPYNTAKLSLELLETMNDLAKYGNGNATSDVGVASLLASAACKGAILNVQINLNSLPEHIGVEMRTNLSAILDKCSSISRMVIHSVRERISLD